MKHIWSVFCRSFLEDKRTNNMSLIEVTERISFKSELSEDRPVNLPLPSPFYLISNWQRNEEGECSKYKTRLRFLSPQGEELLNLEHEVNLEEVEKMRVNGELGSVPYTENGVYEFEISYKDGNDWKTVASIPLEIVHEGLPEPV